MEKTTKQIFSILIFGAICLVFALFGLPTSNLSGGSGGAFVAVVNNTYIPIKDFQMQLAQLEQRFRPYLGDQIAGQQDFLRSQALEQLIRQELLAQESEKNYIYSTDEEVRDFIVELPVFQEKGRFRRERYDLFLKGNGWTAGEFEDQIKKDLRAQRMRELFNVAQKPTQGIVGKEEELKTTKLNFQFVKLDYAVLEEKETLKKSAAEIEDWSRSHMKEISDDYAQNSSKYNKDEEVHARHILIKFHKGNAESEKQALKKITEIAAKAKSEDFGLLAKKFSEDPGSQNKNGDLGFFTRGRMVPEFETVAFSLPIKKISEPVKTEYGYHLIEVLEKKPKTSIPLDQVKLDIAKRLIVREQIKESIAEFKKMIPSKNAKEIEAWLQKHNLKWEETGFFSLSDYSVPKLGRFDDFAEVMGGLSQQSPLADKLVTSGGAEYLLKFKQVEKVVAEKINTEELARDLGQSFSASTLNEWISQARKNSIIKTNARYIRGNSDEG